MTPCNGCGGTRYHEPHVPGYRIRVCECGVVLSVVQHPQRPQRPQRWANRRGKLHGMVALRRVIGSYWLQVLTAGQMDEAVLRRELRLRESRARRARQVAEYRSRAAAEGERSEARVGVLQALWRWLRS